MAYPESAHPYPINADETQTWTSLDPATTYLLVTFDVRTEVLEGFDVIHVTDGSDVEIRFSPFDGTELAVDSVDRIIQQTVLVRGDTVKVRLVSTEYNQYTNLWGYAVTNIQEFTSYPSDPTAFINDQFDFQPEDASKQDFVGPFEFGNDLYVVIEGEHTSRPGMTIAGVFKSTDRGNTWSIQDVANSPQWSCQAVVSDGSQYIWLAWGQPDDPPGANVTIKLIKFDTATDTFGTATTEGPLTTLFQFMKLLPSGSVRVFYAPPALPAPSNGVLTAVYSGTWAEGTVIAALSPVADQVACDASGVCHVIYHEGEYPNRKYYYVQVAVGSSLSATILVKTVGISGQDGEPWNWGNPSFYGTKLLFPFSALDDDIQRRPWWIEIDPYASLTPSFTIGSFDDEHTEGALWVYAWGSGTTMYYWTLEAGVPPHVDPDPHLDRIVYYTNDGTGWSVATVFHDETADPIVYDHGPYAQTLFAPSIARLSDDWWGVMVGLSVSDTTWPGGIYSGKFYFASSEAPPPPPPDEPPPTGTVILGTNDSTLVIDLSATRGGFY